MTEATDALRQWREADKHPVAVILRRSSFRIVRSVGELVGEEILVLPGGPTHVEDVVDEGVHRGTSTPPP